jgi:hypothetical protein
MPGLGTWLERASHSLGTSNTPMDIDSRYRRNYGYWGYLGSVAGNPGHLAGARRPC